MIKAVVLDCFGVIHVGSGIDWELLGYVANLKKSYKTAMLSNVNRGFLEQIFDAKHRKEQFFDELVASGEINASKPDPEAYQIVCQRLGVAPEEAIFIDDNDGHCRGAEAVGMTAIVYKNFDQLRQDLADKLG